MVVVVVGGGSVEVGCGARCGNLDIILEHFPRGSQLYAIRRPPWYAQFYPYGY